VTLRSVPLLILCFACGGSPAGSCQLNGTAAQGYTSCIDFTGIGYGTMLVQKNCAELDGGYSSLVCVPGTAGQCVQNGGTQTETRQLYTRTQTIGDAGVVDLYLLCTNQGGAFLGQ
jgi:hypothetical protein